jgi:hypothetical protein
VARNAFKGGKWKEAREFAKTLNALFREHREQLRRITR